MGFSVRGSLSGWVSVQRGLLQEGIYLVGSLSGDLCLGGSLSRGSLCLGGSLSGGVSV